MWRRGGGGQKRRITSKRQSSTPAGLSGAKKEDQRRKRDGGGRGREREKEKVITPFQIQKEEEEEEEEASYVLSCTSSDCDGDAARKNRECTVSFFLLFLFWDTFPPTYLQLRLANSSLKIMCVRHSKPCDRFLYPWFIAKKIFVHRAQTALQCCKLLQAHTDQIRPRRNLRENTLPINTCPRKKYFSLFRDCGR